MESRLPRPLQREEAGVGLPGGNDSSGVNRLDQLDFNFLGMQELPMKVFQPGSFASIQLVSYKGVSNR